MPHVRLAIVRQRQGITSGTVFITLEGETGVANLLVWNKAMEKHRRAIIKATLLVVAGKLQREDGVPHIMVDKLLDLTGMLQGLTDNAEIAHSNNRTPTH